MSTPLTPASPQILIVDDDADITALLQGNLQSEGYTVEVCRDAEQALCSALDAFSLIVSETRLPGEIDGYELLERVKDSRLTAHIPVIFCTVADGENDIIAGLNAGADDYVVKPFSLREFIARIRSVLRRHRNMAPAQTRRVIEYKTLILNIDSHGLLIDGDSVALSPTEFELLTLLLRSRNRFFSRDEILAAVWPGEEMSNPRTIDVNISRLRKKLAAYGKYIVNRSGLGYGFVDEA